MNLTHELNLVLDLIQLSVMFSILLMLHRSYLYIRSSVVRPKQIDEAALEIYQRSLKESVPAMQGLLAGFLIIGVNHFRSALISYRLMSTNTEGPYWGDPVTLLLTGAGLSLALYGFALYVKILERYKPTYLHRPFDRRLFRDRFDKKFGYWSTVAFCVAVVLAVVWSNVEHPTLQMGFRMLFGLWHLVLLVVVGNYIKRSNIPLQRTLMTAIVVWSVAAIFSASRHPVLERIAMVFALISVLRLLVTDFFARLEELERQSEKISRDKNIMLSFLSHVASAGDQPEAVEGSFDLKRLMQSTLEFAMEQTQATAGAIFLISENNPRELYAQAVQGPYPPMQDLALDLVTFKEKYIADLVLSERIQVGEGLIGAVAASGQPIRVEDAEFEPRIQQSRLTFLQVENQLVTPIKAQERIEGVLSLINRGGTEQYSPPFDVHDQEFLMAVGEQAAIAIRNARMHKILAEQEIIQREIQIAQEVQGLLLPKESPRVEGFDIEGFSRSARRVGGDYYDFIWMDEKHLAIIIADVAGKGVPGAITMAMVRSALKGEIHRSRDVRDILTELNWFVFQDTKSDTFVSMFLAVLDIETRKLTLARAGHEPPIYISSQDGRTHMLEPGGIALGMDGGELFFQTLETSEITLNPGDVVVFYTDGVTEAMNSEGEEFSMNRFMDTLMQSKDSGAGRMLEAIRKRVSDFTGDLPQQDDLTLVLLKAAPKPERT